jgi:hypothetical protein
MHNVHHYQIVLLADAACRHVAIELASVNITEGELTAIARSTSEHIGVEMDVYATLPVTDHPRAVEKARALLRFSEATVHAPREEA